MTSAHVVLARRPQGAPVPEDFRLETRELPAPREGQLLVEVLFATANPGSRNRMGGDASYARGMRLGETMEGPAVGRVLVSNHPEWRQGDLVTGAFGWAERALSSGRGLRRIPARTPSLSAWAGILNLPGLTAYFGLRDVAGFKPGETLIVSSAAGPVGATAGQIARLMGGRAIGIASGAERKRWLLEEAGFAAVIDRSAPDLADALIATAGEGGAQVYFDNVGGPVLDAAIRALGQRGRIVVSGQIADYNRPDGERSGTRRVHEFIGKRLRMEGMVVFDYAERFGEAEREIEGWIADGRLKFREHIVDGLAALPALFCAQLRGEIFGRALAKVAS